MTPVDFRRFVQAIAARVGFDPTRIILGGDHLGPNPWRGLPAEEAMHRARVMVQAYAKPVSPAAPRHEHGMRGRSSGAGRTKSQRARGSLAKVAEAAVGEGPDPVYVIGTEVPGSRRRPARPRVPQSDAAESALRTVEAHRQAFRAYGIEKAFARAIAVVVQPGVEFASTEVIGYQPDKAGDLAASLAKMPGFVFRGSLDRLPDRRIA